MTSIQIEVLAGDSLFDVLSQIYPGQLDLSQPYAPNPEKGLEGGRFLNAIRGVLEPVPAQPPEEIKGEWLAIVAPSGELAGFGVDHVVTPEEQGLYTLEARKLW